MKMDVSPDRPPQVARPATAAVIPYVSPPGAESGPTQQVGALMLRNGRVHLDELDRLRVITAMAVVAVHVLAMSAVLDRTPRALQTQFALVHALHFTREVFVFVTAMALVYVYYDKPFSPSRFWKRRGIGVLLPYVVWSMVYVALNTPARSPLLIVGTLLWDVLTGGASYQLYYILLTIQFYLLLPWFLRMLRRVAQHPWMVLGTSFALQIGLLWAASVLLTAHVRLPGGLQAQLPLVCDRFVLMYQFYLVLGAMAALHVRDIRAFLLRHGPLVLATTIGALIAWEAHYTVAVAVAHTPVADASSVVQPDMAVYSTAVIGAFYWLVYRGLAPRSTGAARGQRSGAIWRALSNAAFGIYLVHPLFLSATLVLVVPHLQSWSVAVLVACIWLLTVTAATSLSLLLLATPVLSRLVGHPHNGGEARIHVRIQRTLAMVGSGAGGPGDQGKQGAAGGSHGSHQSARLRSAGTSMYGSGGMGHLCAGERG